MLVYYVLKGNQLKHYSVHSSDIIRSMADSQAYCLRRTNHSSDMIDVFDRMFKDESMTDCALMCAEGHVLKAHRVVLSASSPFFKSVFEQLSNQWPNYPIVFMKDMPISDLKAIIEFIYRGEVTVGQQQLQSVLKNGESLQIKGLIDIDRLEEGSNSLTTISRKRRRRRHRRKSSQNENNKNGEQREDNTEDNNRNYNSSDDYISEYSDGDGSRHSLADTPTDMSGSRTYNESVGASEDGIEPSKLLEQSMITGDTQESNSINQFSSSNPNLMSNTDEEDVKPILFDESMCLMSHISNDCNSDSTLNHTTNDSQTPLIRQYDTSGIPSIPGTSSSQNTLRILSGKPKGGHYCHKCQKRFDVRDSLVRHIRVIHEQNYSHICGQCGRQFTWRSAYLRHIKLICHKQI